MKMPNLNNELPVSDDEVPGLRVPHSPRGTPPRQTSLAEVMETARSVSNLSIAHEIVVNRDFRFKQNSPTPDSLEGRVKEIVHRAFWDSLEAQLAHSPPDYSHAIKLLQEIKETLLSLLLPAHSRLRSRIEEALDMDLIRQQTEHGALDLPRVAGFVIGTMATLCAPVRDDEIRGLRELRDPAPLLREILRVLGLMKVDMVNFTVQSLRPHLLQQSVQYERAKFQEILDKQPDALDHTTAWLNRAVQEAATAPSNKGPGKTSTSPSPAILSPSAVLDQAYLSLLRWDPFCQLYPETVQMDRSRLDELKRCVDVLTLMASVLLVTSNQCGGNVFPLPGFVGKLKQVIAALLEGSHHRTSDLVGVLQAVGEQVKLQVGQALREHGGAALTPEQETTLKGQISDIAQDHSPIRSVIAGRIFSFLKSFLGPPAQKSSTPLPGGLAPVGAELAEVGAAFGRIVHHNRLVFGPFYSSILKRALFPQGESETSVDSR
ncbi:T-complex protein 11-like protein 1 isoform X1 [Acipenser ruthenus]|uniref:T-complex protein 11-like protein 1 isoform X1 n=1 Tax=Acipenser ruthenus TaxID=7906 RepID=UPI0027421CDB|nr:T-complex protein 11-like protein 1 isoform X1 [Acipenser ruthenus]XP_058860242.1 T-complex protein 11-like protein 1 isoform X1 [Acipenser ruthenus]